MYAIVAIVLAGTAPSTAEVKAAAERALPLLAKAAAGHAEKRDCFACHNQASPMAAFHRANARGFALPDGLIREQAEHIHEFLTKNKENFRSGKGTGGQVDTAGWALFTLQEAGHKPDDTTAAVVEYLLKKDEGKDHWPIVSNRPPTEASLFTANYVAIRGVQHWATDEQRERARKRIDAVKTWLVKTKAKDTEDRVFRLLSLSAAGAERTAIADAAAELLKSQRFEGSWGQLETLPGDPYATATVLMALLETGAIPVTNPAFQRGLGFLLRTQRPDGSWFVHSRSKPFQPYYESGFPYKNDQFISVATSGWATVTLLRALP